VNLGDASIVFIDNISFAAATDGIGKFFLKAEYKKIACLLLISA
jgi:hypothetical protein